MIIYIYLYIYIYIYIMLSHKPGLIVVIFVNVLLIDIILFL